MESEYEKVTVYHDCPVCGATISLDLAVKNGYEIKYSEIIGIDKP